MLNEFKLQVFCSLAETLNFTDTARKLFVSQQTVSRLISELEQELGLALFERSSRKVTLTLIGERYYKVVVDMIWSYEQALADIKKGLNGDQGISINVQLNLDIGQGAQIAMEELRKKYTVLSTESLRISPSQLLHRLDTHKCDVVILLDRFYKPNKKFLSQPLFPSEYLILASPDLISPDSENYDVLLHSPLLYDALESESPVAYKQRCQQEITELGLTPSEIIWLPNADSAFSRAEVSDGIAITSSADRVGFGRRLIGFPTGKRCQALAIWRADETNVLVKPYIQFMAAAYQNEYRNFIPSQSPIAFYSDDG